MHLREIDANVKESSVQGMLSKMDSEFSTVSSVPY